MLMDSDFLAQSVLRCEVFRPALTIVDHARDRAGIPSHGELLLRFERKSFEPTLAGQLLFSSLPFSLFEKSFAVFLVEHPR